MARVGAACDTIAYAGWPPGFCPALDLPSSYAPAAHLRLASGPVVPPGRPARGAGGVPRPPRRDRPAERVDAVVVSGDVYDRAVPPLAAVELFDDALHRLARLGCPGRDDHRQPRLGPPARRRRRPDRRRRHPPAHRRRGCGTPVLLADAHGEVAFYGLPYLEPAVVRGRARSRRPSHAAVLAAAMDRVRADLAGARRRTRSVVLAHAFVTGGAASDSERDITVGGVASVPAAVFDGVDYVALGHLHGAQPLTERVRYSGSPLPYSFSEEHHRKTMWLVDLGAGQAPPCGRARSTARCPARWPGCRGRLEDLLTGPGWAGLEDHYLSGDPHRPGPAGATPMARLRRRFPHILSLGFAPERLDRDEPGVLRRPAPRPQRPGDRRGLRGPRARRRPEEAEEALLAAASRRRPAGRGRHLMRLHRLEVTAFGPFAGTEQVDFDELAAAGLFLLHGPTGAGKTTVLDAVCYALYGPVPGARQAAARALRSDHAAAGAAPRSRSNSPRAAAGWRSPGHRSGSAPSARHRHGHRAGSRACVEECTGAWLDRALATRLDEAVTCSAAARHEPRAVLPGGAAAAGRLRALPAGRRREAPRPAGAALRHPPVRRGRALAGRQAPGGRSQPRRGRSAAAPGAGPHRRGGCRRGSGRPSWLPERPSRGWRSC